jgi:excisionase family DNA binding protein
MLATERATFYTVAEAAHLLRVDAATIYRAIREDAFPAIRVRTRYVIPAAAAAFALLALTVKAQAGARWARAAADIARVGTSAVSLLVNGFYIPFDEDRDEVTPVITRAMALLAEHGRRVPATDTEIGEEDGSLRISTCYTLSPERPGHRGGGSLRTAWQAEAGGYHAGDCADRPQCPLAVRVDRAADEWADTCSQREGGAVQTLVPANHGGWGQATQVRVGH